MLCATISGPSFSKAKQQILDSLPLVDSIELRIDAMPNLSNKELSSLIAIAKSPICTFKKSLAPSTATWIKKIQELAALSPTYLDIDKDFPIEVLQQIQKSYPNIKIILSYHSEKNENLHEIHCEMLSTPANYYKIVVSPETTIETLKYMKSAYSLPKNTTTLCLGEQGLASRIFSPLVGNAINYAAGVHTFPVAPGQPYIQDLLAYNYKNISKGASIYGLIGSPIDRSLSHITHNKLFSKLNLNASYIKLAITPEQLSEFFRVAKNLPFQGLSVTMPLKTTVLNYVDILDDTAKQCGSVNTLIFREGVTFGHNTDGLGILNLLNLHKIPIKNQHIAILGAGGAAKAIATTLANHGAQIHIFNRTRQHTEELAQRCNGKAYSLQEFKEFSYSDMVINTLPSNIDFPWRFPPIVIDINTLPKETHYTRIAKQQGSFVLYGYEMFIEQALLQFALWFPKILSQKFCNFFRKDVQNLMNSLG
ncbi:bifunctional 3-dehydroquinate dehydratase/shikimate dehydrogenase [Chlamydia sp. 17-3921]|uniref:bifunctional 3-dehydroquinate dehydratase/shikimate dehydrogenase n=1 Tax=Chlamydia sp. 17-3921 TaxID=2675798 RepID=UPI00191A5FB5|nr:bifunctional 3-dehydroquinate dehydratase/shikimate dehydrogenase [Chlamydia sp. 17-3921]